MYINEKERLAVEIDEENEILLSYNIENGIVMETSSEGILKEITEEIGKEIEEHFNIDINQYGVCFTDERLSMEELSTR